MLIHKIIITICLEQLMSKKVLSSILIMICVISLETISQQLPNQGFEEWKTDDSKLFEDLAGGFWGTINRLRLLGPLGPITTEKSTDAHSGSFSAKITTKTFGSFKIVGIIATGIFDQKSASFVEGMPFSSKPSKLSGYYKFLPVNNDSCSAYINLSKYNTISNKKDTIAEGLLVLQGAQNQWTKFEVPLNYYLNITPDTIKVAFVSSAGTVGMGSTQNAQVGSSMLVDDLILDYGTDVDITSTISSKIKLEYSQMSSSLILNDNYIDDGLISIYTSKGKMLLSKDFKLSDSHFDFSTQPCGVYLYKIFANGTLVSCGSFIK